MPLKRHTQESIIRADWHVDREDGATLSDITAMSVAYSAKTLERVVNRLDTVISRLDVLGHEGLHDLVKEMAREARAKRKRRLARQRRARLKLVKGGAA